MHEPGGLKKREEAVKDPVWQGVIITHPARIIDPDSSVTKGRLAEYYALVSPFLLRNVSSHALTLIRCPQGISGERFYQRSVGTGLGAEVKPFKWKHKGLLHNYFYTETTSGLHCRWCRWARWNFIRGGRATTIWIARIGQFSISIPTRLCHSRR